MKAYRGRNERKSVAFWASKVGDWLGERALESEPVKGGWGKKRALIKHPVFGRVLPLTEVGLSPQD